MVTLADIEAARDRIRGHIRTTPLIAAAPYRTGPITRGALHLKLESLQVSGSFKARGALNTVLNLSAPAGGLVTASSGNHGIGVACAARVAGRPARVYLPANAPESKAERLRQWDAEVVRTDGVWDNANRAALAAAGSEGLTYVHPFADPRVIAGQGTVGLEVVAQLPDIDVVIAAIGGGGLISGVALALKALRPEVRVYGVEPMGAPTLHDSLTGGGLTELASIDTVAASLAPRQSHATNLGIVRDHVSEIVLVSDTEMRDAARWLWQYCGVAAEIGAAAPIAALMTGRISTEANDRVCAIVSGSGTDGLSADQDP